MNNWLTQTLTTAAQGATNSAPAGESGGGLFGDPVMIAMIGTIMAFYFFLIVPTQRKQRREQTEWQSMLDNLAKGDEVITAGGIHGKVEKVNKEKETVTLTIAPKITIDLERSKISKVLNPKKGGKSGEDKAVKVDKA